MCDILKTLRLVAGLALTDAFDFVRRGSEAKRTFGAIENDRRSVSNLQGSRFDAGDGRDLEGARQNGDVRSRAAADGGKTDDRAAFHRGGVGRRQVFGDENG